MHLLLLLFELLDAALGCHQIGAVFGFTHIR